MRDLVGPDRRGQLASTVGLVIQLIGVAVLLALGIWSGAQSVMVGGRHMLGGALIWVVLILVFTQRKRASLKDREIEELKRAREADPSLRIFELEEGSVERRRLAWMYRWLFLIATVALAAYHIVASLFVKWAWDLGTPLEDDVWTSVSAPGPVMALVAGVGFVCFLYSRYAAGMARQGEWRLLRAGASYLAGNALACLAVVVSVGLQSYDVSYGEPIVAHGVRILMLLIGVEFLIALVLNFYRPRIPGEEPRPAFDSRLLEMISEPGGVARSIADAVNYQFGFEVTKTWFAQLLRRAFFPLVVLGLLTLLLLSSVVIVDAGEMAFVEHFGRLKQPVDQPWGPGLHFKWPWPIDCVYRAPVRRLQQTMVGGTPKKSPYDEQGKLRPVLWAEEHDFTYEMMTVVASPPQTDYDRLPGAGDVDEDDGEGEGKAVAVSLMNISVPIEYRIKNLYDYLYRYEEASKVLEVIAFRELSDYAASVDADRIMAAGRAEFATKFRQQVQEEADRLRLGIEITFLALQDAHPPARGDVAKSFQQVIIADMGKNTAIETARGEAREMLTLVAGNVNRAEELVTAARKRNELAETPGATQEEKALAARKVNDLLQGNAAAGVPRMSGEAAQVIAEAQARRTQALSEAESKARLFQAEVVAYEAADQVYKVRKYLEMLKESLDKMRKFVLAADASEMNLIVVFETEKKSVIDIAEETE